jgi:hypothetical protein
LGGGPVAKIIAWRLVYSIVATFRGPPHKSDAFHYKRLLGFVSQTLEFGMERVPVAKQTTLPVQTVPTYWVGSFGTGTSFLYTRTLQIFFVNFVFE